jgi:hypothetical protein
MFDAGCPANDARDVANEFKSRLKEELAELRGFSSNASQYPFLASLKPLEELMAQITSWDYSRIIKEVADFEDKLLDAKEDTWDPIRKFWNGEQKAIFDKVRIYVQGNQSNFEFVGGDELEVLKSCYSAEKPFAGNLIRDAKSAMDALSDLVKEKLELERKNAMETTESALHSVKQNLDYQKLNKEEQALVTEPFEELISKIKENRFIANLRQFKEDAVNLKSSQLNKIQELKSLKASENGVPMAAEELVHYIRTSQIRPDFSKTELETEEDVQEYLDALKEAMLKMINDKKRILL